MRQPSRPAVVALVAAAQSLAACDGQAIDATPASIISGHDDVASPPSFPSVAFVTSDSDCTGSLITPSHILLAAHCVDTAAAHAVDFAPVNAPGHDDATTYAVSECWMWSRYTQLNLALVRTGLPADVADACGVLRRIGVDGSSDPAVDLALLRLARPVAHPIPGPNDVGRIGGGGYATWPMLLLATTDTPAGPFTAVGYGETCSPSTVGGCPLPGGTRRWALASISWSSASWVSTAPAAAEVVGSGDSGGPLLVEIGGNRVVVAVAHAEDTTGRDLWTSLGAQAARDWIQGHTDENGDGFPDVTCPGGLSGSDPEANSTNDQDGDYILDANEPATSRGIFNPCQLDAATYDADADGVADDVDACPAIATITALRGTLADDDHDGLANACDCARTTPAFEDSDGDYIPDACDNCPRVANTNQANCDGDAQGDACDPDDRDRDGVTDACDNCPPPAVTAHPELSRNDDQANCNEDAERASGRCPPTGPCVDAAGASLLHGDACDPNPCAYTYTDTQPQNLNVSGILSTDLWATPTLLRTHGVVGGPDVRTGTDMRFCACSEVVGNSIAGRRACALTHGCTIAVAGAFGSTATDLFDTDPTLPAPVGVTPPLWRHMTFGITSVTTAFNVYHSALPSRVWPVGSDQQYDWRLWQPGGDRDRWIAPYGDSSVDPAQPAFPGVLWTNSPPARPSTVRELRSFYTSGMYAPQHLFTRPSASDGSHLFPIPDCIGQIPCPATTPWLHVAVGSIGGNLIFTHSTAYAAPASLFPSAPLLRATDLVWTHVAEPIALLRPEHTLRMVSTSLDGTRVADVLHLTQYGYAPRAWHPACPGGPNCPPSSCGVDVPPEQCLNYQSPPGDPLFVLSASRHELFIVTDELVALDLGTGFRRSIDLSGVHFAVLRAATYDVLSDRVFVIDETAPVHGRGPASARLVEIDPQGGAQIVARWPRYAPTSRFALGAAQDGSLYLAASGEHGRYALVALRVVHHRTSGHHATWDEVIANGIATGEGVVVSDTTYASRFAVTFVVARDGLLEVAEHDPARGLGFGRGDPIAEVF